MIGDIQYTEKQYNDANMDAKKQYKDNLISKSEYEELLKMNKVRYMRHLQVKYK